MTQAHPTRKALFCEEVSAPVWQWPAVARVSLSGTSSVAWEVGVNDEPLGLFALHGFADLPVTPLEAREEQDDFSLCLVTTV